MAFWRGRYVPQGLKPASLLALVSAAEAVHYPKSFCETSSSLFGCLVLRVMPLLRLRAAWLRQVSTRLFALLLCISASVAAAQIGVIGKQPAGSDAPRHAISGMVINAVTGEPIARAVVELSAQSPQHIMTDANGSFRFENVTEGAVTLTSDRPGFFDEISGRGAPPVLVQVSADVDGVTLKLVPQAVIAGRISSIQGVPIEDFPVRLYRRNMMDGRVQWLLVGQAISDEDGQFRMAGLMPGSYCISAGPENWRPRASGTKQLGYPHVFYPNVSDFSAASSISLSAGQQAEADFSLNQEPLFEVSGQIAGIPATADVTVQLTNQPGEPVPLMQPHPERHEFSGHVTAGWYTLRASAQVEGQLLQATVPLNIASNAAGIQVVVGPQVSIPVNVRSESADANPSRAQDIANASVRLVSTANSLSPSDFWARRIAANPPTMGIIGMEPGTYSVEVNSNSSSYVQSAISGSTDLLRDDLVVPSSGRVAPIEVVLRDDGGGVSGRVQIADHEGGATVLLVPERGSTKEIKTAAAQGTGEFQFEHVRPGDYSLLAFDRVDDLEYRNPEVLSSYLSSAAHVSVPPKQHVKANLELIQLGK